MKRFEIKSFLDDKAFEYESPLFINEDPIQIPHKFSKKEDIEISGFLTAIISWGNRKIIIKNANSLMNLMDNSPFDFILNHNKNDLNTLNKFVHRTFNNQDLCFFIKSLYNIYKNNGGLENVFKTNKEFKNLNHVIHNFKNIFFSIPHQKRTEKHISDPLKGSAAKRINMFLRWMVRSPKKGVDFGLWKNIDSGQLSCPLDIHSGRVARSLSLIKRKQNDNLALMELDSILRKFDYRDPVKYDFALFGLSKYEKFH
ncbi:MAG: TIGR02757 family protein [Flavobacteriaceae bacterium]|nr:TIGR02757 family protein [Flavobacteriaceae bacterium]|tara:strand:+ start:17524 stop:18291 length:768 start_codon:yes stop_codon:yes gene_type:complete